jgi:translation initiation factor 5
MSLVNINRLIKDPFYRYKMHSVELKIEGSGNGIKTVISNMVDIGKALDRPPSYLCKYLGSELGVRTQIKIKDNKYILSGKFEKNHIQDLLDGFIKMFVLCHDCGNPETKLRITSKKLIESKCIACGHRCHLPMIHKLTTFIIHNPPKCKGGDSSSNIEHRVNGGKIDAPEIVEDCAEDDDWSVDTSEDAVRARSEGLGSAIQFAASKDLEMSKSTRLDIFNKFVEKKFKNPEEVIREAKRLEVMDKGIMVLISILWDTSDIPSAMKEHKSLFHRFTFGNRKTQMYVLNALEKLIELDESRLNKIMRYLKTLYDLDLIDEEVFIDWEYTLPKFISKDFAMKIRSICSPFLTWIKESEEEESSDDENVVFVSVPIVSPVNTKLYINKDDSCSGDDDLDIDNM